MNSNLIYEILYPGTENGLLISVLGNFSLFCLTGLITLILLVWKLMGLLLRKNHLLRCWGCLSLLNWIGALILSLLLKLHRKNLETWFDVWSFFLLRLLCISINLPYGLTWNTVGISGLVFLGPIWKCYISYKNGYLGLLFLYLLPFLNPWLMFKM